MARCGAWPFDWHLEGYYNVWGPTGLSGPIKIRARSASSRSPTLELSVAGPPSLEPSLLLRLAGRQLLIHHFSHHIAVCKKIKQFLEQ